MRISARLLLTVCALSCLGLAGSQKAPEPTVTPSASAVAEANAAANREVVAGVMREIAGRETQPAESVFANVKIPWLGKTQARTFLAIMEIGYARALGVRCTYCHTERNFASDAKGPKLAAREMAVMHRMINVELGKMQHIPTPANEDRAINCATCHRGATRPLR